jgi:hypothetical protein
MQEVPASEQPPVVIELTRQDDAPKLENAQDKLKIVTPFVHLPNAVECDFCASLRSQRYKMDISAGPSRELRVCASAKCDAQFQESVSRFYAQEDRVPLQVVENAVPSLLDTRRSWRVVRGNGEIDDGWKVVRNWRVAPDMGALQRLRGEPWWRIPLQKGDKVRLTLLEELRQHNAECLSQDTWDMLLGGVLPAIADGDPNDTFLEFYPARVWRMPCPGDAKLLELRI